MEGSDKHTCVVLVGVELESGVQHCLDSAVVRETVSFYLKPRTSLTKVSTEMGRGGNGYEQRRS